MSEVLLAAIGATSALYAVWDIASDVLSATRTRATPRRWPQLTGIPAIVWGVVWIAVSVGVLGYVVKRLA